MSAPPKDHLRRFNNIGLAVVLVFGVMYLAGDFLIPLIFGVLVATLMVPFCRWMEQKGVARGLAAMISALSVFVILTILVSFLAWQVSSFSEELPVLKERLLEHVSDGHDFMQATFGLAVEDVPDATTVKNGSDTEAVSSTAPVAGEAVAEGSKKSASGNATTITRSQAMQHGFEFLKIGFGTLFTAIIIFAYIVLFLYYRHRLRDAIVMIFPEERKERTKHALKEAGSVGQSYLGGMFIVTTILGTLNSLALLAIGIDHPFLFGYVAGYLNFIPFVGTLLGSILPITMALLTKSTIFPALLVGASFMVVQVLEETVLTPNIVGDKVNVNPLFIIVAIVIGNMIWGIAGVVLFIPLMAIAKIIFDHVEELKPLAHFLGQHDEEKPTLFRRMRNKFSRSR